MDHRKKIFTHHHHFAYEKVTSPNLLIMVEEDLWQRQSRLQVFEDRMFTVAIYIDLKNHHQAIAFVGIVVIVVG